MTKAKASREIEKKLNRFTALNNMEDACSTYEEVLALRAAQAAERQMIHSQIDAIKRLATR